MEVNNSTANALKVTGTIIIVLCILAGLICAVTLKSLYIFLICIFSGLMSGLIFLGLAEIIDYLNLTETNLNLHCAEIEKLLEELVAQGKTGYDPNAPAPNPSRPTRGKGVQPLTQPRSAPASPPPTRPAPSAQPFTPPQRPVQPAVGASPSTPPAPPSAQAPVPPAPPNPAEPHTPSSGPSQPPAPSAPPQAPVPPNDAAAAGQSVSVTTSGISPQEEYFFCPNCGKKQFPGRPTCWNCGVKFE
ncbi:hypothetical protein [Zongyangia hominis]|uniref:Uncharacterized protein n=1 Tax=Zongyangia hominis TaxID=2763677 RepID=A0A926EF87_9FIRM|nr:hypothetical protein [Zongyangia hominis]MBC8570612.1 hypothetical protein [Zongyangia hominis]